MKSPFKPETIKRLILVLSLMLFVKLGWFVAEMTILNAKGVNQAKSSKSKSLYYRTRFATQKLKQKKVKVPKILNNIGSYKLLAIYRSPEHVVITVSKGSKSSVLVKGDKIDGYVLTDATAKEAIFLRDGKSYRIRLTESSSSPKGKINVEYITNSNTSTSHKNDNSNSKEKSEEKGEILEDESVTVIDRKLLDHYKKNINDIWKNIGISDVKKDGRIKGFKINFVKRGSDFAKLGLRRGDVIKSINGQEINDYKSAFESYKNIDIMNGLTLTIQRGKEEMELEYEIN